jgi:hypothetical protein
VGWHGKAGDATLIGQKASDRHGDRFAVLVGLARQRAFAVPGNLVRNRLDLKIKIDRISFKFHFKN